MYKIILFYDANRHSLPFPSLLKYTRFGPVSWLLESCTPAPLPHFSWYSACHVTGMHNLALFLRYVSNIHAHIALPYHRTLDRVYPLIVLCSPLSRLLALLQYMSPHSYRRRLQNPLESSYILQTHLRHYYLDLPVYKRSDLVNPHLHGCPYFPRVICIVLIPPETWSINPKEV